MRGREVAIIGVGATVAGTHPGMTPDQLGMHAFKEAINDAGISKSTIDGLLGGASSGAGTVPEKFAARIGINPKITQSLAYPSSAFTLHHAAFLIYSGMCEVVACVFARNPPGAMEALSGPPIYNAAHGLINANAVAALGFSQYMARYGASEQALADVVVAARQYACLTPGAAYREPLTFDEYFAAPFLVWPYRSFDIAKAMAGGVAVIVARRSIARQCASKPVYLEAYGRRQATRGWENDEHLLCWPMKDVAKQVYGQSGLRPKDIDVLAIYDATSGIVLQTLENYGFCGDGEAKDFVKDGRIAPGGDVALNTFGGHLAGGYLFGWFHHVEIVRQLRGVCGERQRANARIAQFCTTGGMREHYASTIFVTE
jgi:acetyl-CoA acetyltransferase